MYQGLSYEIANVIGELTDAGICVWLASFIQPPATFDAGGAPTGDYEPVTDLQDIECMIAAASPDSMVVSPGEVRLDREILASSVKTVLLTGYYPQIELQAGDDRPAWRVKIRPSTSDAGGADEITYGILSAEPDSQRGQTRLLVRKAAL